MSSPLRPEDSGLEPALVPAPAVIPLDRFLARWWGNALREHEYGECGFSMRGCPWCAYQAQFRQKSNRA